MAYSWASEAAGRVFVWAFVHNGFQSYYFVLALSFLPINKNAFDSF